MATAEQADFSVPSVEERDDLVLAGVNDTARQTGSITAAADRAAQTAHSVLGVDKQEAEDTFTGQLEAIGAEALSDDVVPVVLLRVGTEDGEGNVWTPSHVIKGHDDLKTKDGKTIPETFVWADMYANRPANWWNKTRPESEGESELIEVPLQVVLADVALRGVNPKKNWSEQQAELAELIRRGSGIENVTVEGMPILAWAMMDADAIVHGTNRPDTQTATRFVQHEMDRVGGGVSCGPRADVGGRGAGLGRSRDDAYSYFGFRGVMGQKQQPN